MPCETNWYIEKRVISTRFYGEVTEADVVEAADMTQELVNVGVAPVFLLVDMNEITTSALNIVQAMKARQRDSKILWSVILADDNVSVSIP